MVGRNDTLQGQQTETQIQMDNLKEMGTKRSGEYDHRELESR